MGRPRVGAPLEAISLLLVLAAATRPLDAGIVARVPGAHGFLNASSFAPAEANSKFAADAGAADTCVYGMVMCYADATLLPSSTEELASGIAGLVAAAAAGGKPLSVRATSSVFHSTSPFTCPSGYGGGLGSPLPPTYGPLPPPPTTSSAAPATAAVLLDSLRGVSTPLLVGGGGGGAGGNGGGGNDPLAMTVLAGSRLWQVWHWAEERGLSPPRGVPTVWSDLSVGGVISASSHGSGGVGRPSAFNDIVTEFVWVDATGTIHRSAHDSPEGRAIAGGMGLLGVVTEVTLRMEPLSKTAALTLTAKSDQTMAADAARLQQVGGDSTSVALLWRPDVKKYNAYILVDAGNATTEAALYSLAAQRGDPLAAKLASLLETSKTGPGPTFSEATPPGFLQLASAFVRTSQLDANETGAKGSSAALGAASCGLGLGAQVLQQMASSRHALVPLPLGVGSTGSILGNWQPPDSVIWAGREGVALDEIEMVIEQDDFEAWVKDVQLIFSKGLGGGGGPRCAPLAYFLIRFGNGVADDISISSGMRAPVLAAYAILRSRALPDVPAKYSFIQEEIEQLTVCKYRGRPHWGKNFARTFTNPDCPVRDLYPNFDRLLAEQAIHDPLKVFEPPLFSAVAARSGPLTTAPLCALRKLCYCSLDDQCAAGWACRPAGAFPQYNVCVPAGLRLA